MKSVFILLLIIVVSSVAWADMPGEKLFNRKCAMCHIVHGRGGAIGPDLSRIGGRMSAAQLQAKVAYPKKSNPGTSMPSFVTLESTEMQSLISYLTTLR